MRPHSEKASQPHPMGFMFFSSHASCCPQRIEIGSSVVAGLMAATKTHIMDSDTSRQTLRPPCRCSPQRKSSGATPCRCSSTPNLAFIVRVFGTARIVCGAGLCSGTVSVCPSVCPIAVGGAAMTQPGRRQPGCGSTWPQHGAQQQTRAVSCLQPSDAAEHTLVSVASR